MNDLEQMKKKRNRLSTVIAILIVLNLLLLFVFASSNNDNGSNINSGEEKAVYLSDASTEEPVSRDNIASIASGANFTVALDIDGNVYTWGQNNLGQLGNGTENYPDSAKYKQEVMLETVDSNGNHQKLTNVKQIAAGEYHAAALTNDGKVYVWGYNYYGQTGRDDIRKGLYAKEVKNEDDNVLVGIKQISCGKDFTLVLTEDGSLFGIGNSYDGQIGYYNDLYFTSISAIDELQDSEGNPIMLSGIEKISAGYNHVIILDNQNRVWSFGGDTRTSFAFTTGKQITLDEGITVSKIQAGNAVSMLLDTNGNVYTWTTSQTTLTKVTLPTKDDGTNIQVRDISIVDTTYFIIDNEDNAYSWGINNVGQAGVGSTSTISTPTLIKFQDGTTSKKIHKVSSSVVQGSMWVKSSGSINKGTNYDTAYAVDEDGFVLGCGYGGTADIIDLDFSEDNNSLKLLGDKTRNYMDYIGSLSLKTTVGEDVILKVNEEKDFMKKLKDENYIIGGRVNLYGTSSSEMLKELEAKVVDEDIAIIQESGYIKGLSQGKTLVEIKSSKNTVYVNVIVTDDNCYTFSKIVTRDNFTVALKTDGTVWAWGYNDNLGIKDEIHANHTGIILPTQVKGLEKIRDIAVGEDFVVLIKEDNKVYVWGQKSETEGEEAVASKSILTADATLAAIKVDTTEEQLSNIKSISAGRDHVMALAEDGTVWAWGTNSNGQLGIGEVTPKEANAKKVDLTILDENSETIKQIELGGNTSYILTSKGNVYACGYSGSAQCGARENAVSTLTQVSQIRNATKLSAGFADNCIVATTVNGKVYAWGAVSTSSYIINGLDNVVDVAETNEVEMIYKLSDNTIHRCKLSDYPTDYKFTQPDGTDFKNATAIAGSNGHYIVAKPDGTVWSTGRNSANGQLGNRTVTSSADSKCLGDISKAYIELNQYEVTLEEGKSVDITSKYNYGFNLNHTNNVEQTMTYESLNSNIAEVNGSTITGIKSGKTYVEATSPEGEKLRITVNVIIPEKEVATPKVSVGYEHTVSLKSDGTIWVFGNNVNGELGKTFGAITEPKQILKGVNKYKDVAAGYQHTLMVGTNGKVYAMGLNSVGQLGNKTKENSAEPVVVLKETKDAEGNVTYSELNNIVKVVATGYTSLAIDNEGNMYAWGMGANAYATKVDTYGLKVKDIDGKLILTDDGRVWEYENVNTLRFVDGLNDIVQISSTDNGYFMALSGEAKVYTWVKSSAYKVSGSETSIPTQVSIDESIKPVDIQAGVGSAYIVDSNGDVYSWGVNAASGALGLGSSVTSTATLTKVTELSNVESIAATTYSTDNRRAYAVTVKGSVYGFGYNGVNSLLGNSDKTTLYYDVPTLVGESYAGFIINGEAVSRLYMNKGETVENVEVSLLDAFSLRLANTEGTETTNFEWSVINKDLVTLANTTGKVNTLTAQNIVGEAIIVATDTISGKTARLYVDVKFNDTKVAPKIESVGDHTIALKADGTVWGWGKNTEGQLGILQTGTVKEPTQLELVEKVEVTLTEQQDEEGNVKYLDEEGNEYTREGNNYINSEGKVAIKQDGSKLYKWNSQNNNYVTEKLLDEAGNQIIVTDIATSSNHTLILTTDGFVYSCGNNAKGQLGFTGSNQYLPKKVDELKDIVKVAAGEGYSLALDKYGRLYAFGQTYTSRHAVINSSMPTRVRVLDGVNIETVLRNTVDISNEYLLTSDQKVIALKLFENLNTTGTQIQIGTSNEKVIKIARTSGQQNGGHAAFLTDDGNVYTIGAGSYGQLGNDQENNSEDVVGANYAVKVINGEGGDLQNIRDLYVGDTHTIAMSKDGKVYTWGSNTYSELRNKYPYTTTKVARAYETKEDTRIGNAILVSAGSNYSIVVDETGYAYAWGKGTSGQLGNGLEVNSIDAVRVGTEGIRLDNNHVTLIENGDSIDIKGYNKQFNIIRDSEIEIDSNSASTDLTIATLSINNAESKVTIHPVKAGTTSAVVRSTGNSGEDLVSIVQITVLPEIANIAEDVKLPEYKTITPMTVSGKSHTLILKSDGTVWAYGDNTYGQTASKENFSDKVTPVTFPEDAASIISVAAGEEFSVALDNKGNVYTWGNNSYGQLGYGSSDSYSHNAPTKVEGLSNIVKVVAGTKYCIALNEDGYVYVWGKNSNGSLGTGSTSSVSKPRQISDILGIIDIAAGDNHSMLLKADGTVYVTGSNRDGQLGLGREVVTAVNFTKVEMEKPIEYISAGNKISAAIDVEGNLYTWGSNEKGQLGLGIEDTRVYAPTKVTSISNIESVSAGTDHIQAVTISGELYTTGSNEYGQLGIGEDIESKNEFAKVSKLGNNVMSSSAGTKYGTAIDKLGNVYGFGDYNQGMITRASLTNSNVPVMISSQTSYLDEQEVAVNKGMTYEISANGKYILNVLREDNSTFEYSSVNEEIASVDENGVITGNSIGTTMINVVDEDNKVSTLIVRVIPEDATVSPSVEGGSGFAVVTDKTGTGYAFGKADMININIPKMIYEGTPLKSVKSGDDFAVAIDNEGKVLVIGNNAYGQLGIQGIEKYTRFTRINSNYIKNVKLVDAGSKHAIALDETGTVYVWGDNTNGKLGINSETEKVEIPTAIRPIIGRVISVSAGGNYSSIVDVFGNAYIMGENGITKVEGITGAVKVATGTTSTVVLTNNGNVYEVNNETGSFKWKAQNVVDIATNNDTFMYLNKDKQLYTTGSNSNGQLGRGIASQAKPISTVALVKDDVFTIGGGITNTYCINTKGEVFAAGLNTEGQLGNGIYNDESTTYTKVGDRTFSINELKKDGTDREVEKTRIGLSWKVLVGSEDLKEHAEEEKTKIMLIKEAKEFNAFRNIVGAVNDYSFELTDTNVADLNDIENSNNKEITPRGIINTKTILKVTNKESKETKELEITIVDDKILRIDELYVVDSDNKVFDSEPEGTNEFVVNIEGSKDNGTLNIVLASDTDTLEVSGFEATKDETTGKWVIPGLDLTQPEQRLTLLVHPDGGEETIEYVIILRKGVNLKVDAELLVPDSSDNYVKFIDPTNTTSTVEVTISDSTKQVVIYDTEMNEIAKSTVGTNVLTKVVDVPNSQNEFIVVVRDGTNPDKIERKSKLTIYKSSIDAITVNGLSVSRQDDEENNYVEKFYIEVDDKDNETVDVLMKLRNKNVKSVIYDGETIDLESSEFKVTTDKTNVELILNVLDPVTNTIYQEKHLLEIYKISSNTEIEKIELISADGVDAMTKYPKLDSIEFSKLKDKDNVYELALHDKNADLSAYFEFKVTLKDGKSTVAIRNAAGTYYASPKTFVGKSINIDDNKATYTIFVKAENGEDIEQYTVAICKESEDASIDTITTKSLLENGTYYSKVAEEVDEPDYDYIAKVLKGKDGYDIEFKLGNKYASITDISVAGIEDLGEVLQLKSSGTDGKYLYNIVDLNKLLDRIITVKTQAEYDEVKGSYRVKLAILEDIAEFDSIKLGEKTLDITEDTIEKTITAKESDKLEATSKGEYSKVEVFDVDPTVNTTAEPIASGKHEVIVDSLKIKEKETKTVYVKVTSEDEQISKIKTLRIYRQSDNVKITKVKVGETEVAYTEGEIIKVSESVVTNPTTVTVIPEDSDAIITPAENVELSTEVKTVYVKVVSEDKTEEKVYELKIQLLSANTKITKEVRMDDATIKQDGDFTEKTENNITTYETKVKNGEANKLVVKPEDKNAKVELGMADAETGEITYSNTNTISIDSTKVQTVNVKVTAADGTTSKNYIIKVIPEDLLLKKVTVTDSKGNVKELTESELNACKATVRVHPESNTVKVTITPNSEHYNLSKVTGYVPVVDEDGTVNDVKYTGSISSNVGTINNISLLEDETQINVTVESTQGVTEKLTLTIVRGSVEANLDSVTIKGTENEEGEKYTAEEIANPILVKKEADLYNIIPKAKDYGTCELYKISEANKETDLESINLASEEKITSSTDVELSTEEYQRFVIVVTSEFDGHTKRYNLLVKKAKDETGINDLTITINGNKDKKLKDFGNFDKDNNIDILVPSDIENLSIHDLILASESAKAQWTEIGKSEYKEGDATQDTLHYEVTLPGDLEGEHAKQVHIKVTAENGTEKVYCLNIKKASKDVILKQITLDDTTRKTAVNIITVDGSTQTTVKEAVEKAKATATSSNGYVSLHVAKVNGLEIAHIEEQVAKKDANSLNLDFMNDSYTCVDKDGAEKIIAASDVSKVTIEITITSQEYALYPELYDGVPEEEYKATYTLDITRESSNMDIKIDVTNNCEGEEPTQETIDTSDTENYPFEETQDEDGRTVYVYEYKVPSTQTELVITNVKPNSPQATVTPETPITLTFGGDKSSVEQEFVVKNPVNNKEVIYKIIATKYSANDNIEDLKVNNSTTTKDETEDIYTAVLLRPVNTLYVDLYGIEKDAIADMNIVSINDTPVNVADTENKTIEYEAEDGVKQVRKHLTEQLTNALTQTGIARNDLTNITVEVKVKAEDPDIAERVYTVNIIVEKANLISIDGIDVNGNVGGEFTLTAEDFSYKGNNRYETKEIAVPSSTTSIALTNIQCSAEGVVELTDESGNPIDKTTGITVTTLPARVVINTKAGDIEQQYVVNIRTKSVDTTITTVTADGDTATIPEGETEGTVNVRYTVDPYVYIKLKDMNAKVVSVVPDNGTASELTKRLTSSNQYSFRLSDIKENAHDDSSVAPREIVLTVTVQAEDGNETVYKIKVARQHTENELLSVGYDIIDGESKNLDLETEKTITIPSDKEGITIKSVTTDCDRATVFVKDGAENKNYEDYVVQLEKPGTEKVVTIVVVAEHGEKKEFKVTVRRQSDDTAIKSVSTSGDSTDVMDKNLNAYVLIIKDRVDPSVAINFNENHASIKDVTITKINGVDSINEKLSIEDIENARFTLKGVKAEADYDELDDIRTIEMNVTVQAEDKNITTTYAVLLDRKHAETGIDAINYTQIGDTEAKIANFAENKASMTITIPSDKEGITINSAIITCDKAKVYVKDGEDKVELKDYLVNVDKGTTKTIKLNVISEYAEAISDEYEQTTYTINIRRQSDDTSISGVIVKPGKRTEGNATCDETNKALYSYKNINVNEDARITVNTEAINKVKNVKVFDSNGNTLDVTVSDIISNSFTIKGLAKLYSDDVTEDANELNRTIIVKFEVYAEDENCHQEYTLELTRRHIEATIPNINYSYDEIVTGEDGSSTTQNVTGIVDVSADEIEDVMVGATVEEVNIEKIIPNCKYAKVEITVDKETVPQTDDGFVVDLTEETAGDGCIRNVKVKAIAENGDTKYYTFDIIRMATNASLNKVLVNDIEANKLTEEEKLNAGIEGVEAIYTADVKDSDKSAKIEAISANRFATVSITDVNYTTIDNGKIYDEKGTYNLESVNTRTVTITIVVTPQDVSTAPKTYALVLTLRRDNTILNDKIVVSNADNAEEKKKFTDADFKEKSTSVVQGNMWVTKKYKLLERQYIDWDNIKIGDILVELLEDGTTAQTVKVYKINNSDPYKATEKVEYTIDELTNKTDAFSMHENEGKDIYFEVEITAESGNQGIYVLDLYKKATNTDLISIIVNGKTAELDETDGIYKVNVNANSTKVSLPIRLNGNNNLSTDTSIVLQSVSAQPSVIKSQPGKTLTLTLKNVGTTLDKDATACIDLDESEGKVITAVITVVAEDTRYSKDYTVQITRQHNNTNIKNIVINKGQSATINEVETSVEQIENVSFGWNKYNHRYEQVINVTSQLDTVTVNDINLECKYATGTATVNGVKYQLPLSADNPIVASLPNENSRVTIRLDIVAENGTKLDARYIVLRRMYGDASINEEKSKIERKYYEKTVDAEGNEVLATKPSYDREQLFTNAKKDGNDYKLYICDDQDITKVTLFAKQNTSKLEVKEVKITDRKDNPIDATGKYELSNATEVVELQNSSKVVTLDTSEGRTFVITVKVTAEDTAVSQEYTVTIIRQDSSAEIDKVVEIAEDSTETEIPLDEQHTHYDFLGKQQKDKCVFVKYVNADENSVNTKVYADSEFANVELYMGDEVVNEEGKLTLTNASTVASGTGSAEYEVPTEEDLTILHARITSEDGKSTKEYIVLFIKKSGEDDVTIKTLHVEYTEVDGTFISKDLEPDEDGNYAMEISDTIAEVKVTLTPNYKYANAQVNRQPYEWQKTTRVVKGLNKGIAEKVEVELGVQIPAQQSQSGENVENKQYLYITRISTDNGIAKIETENTNDNITPGDAPQDGHGGEENTFTILLESTGVERDAIDLRIEAKSPRAKLELFTCVDEEIGEQIGTASTGEIKIPGLDIKTDDVTTFIVRVTPGKGEAKEYYIDVVPKSSQAELAELIVGGFNIIPDREVKGTYEYNISDLDLPEIGDVYARATDDAATVRIETLYSNTGDPTLKEATLADVDLVSVKCITITVTAPNGKNTKEYRIWLQNVADNTKLKELSYTTDTNEEPTVVKPKASENKEYAGEYEIILEPEQKTVNISMIAEDSLSMIAVEDKEFREKLSLTKDVKSMSEDIVLDIVVTAESDNTAKYKLTIKKRTIATGKIITENKDKNYEGIEVKFINTENPEEEAVSVMTDKDGKYSVELVPGNYNMVVAKDGYLTYTTTNVPVVYGVRRYIGNSYLIAGEVSGDDEYIDIRDLVAVNKLARKNTDSSNPNYNAICDFNEDGIINNEDLTILRNHYELRAEDIPYVRVVELQGRVLDTRLDNQPIENAIVSIREKTSTDADGIFKFENVEAKEYMLTVTDAQGNILGEESLSIADGEDYVITNNKPGNVITLDVNTIFVDIDIRVNGTRAVITKHGAESAEDITPPKIDNAVGEITSTGIKLSADITDNKEVTSVKFVTKDGTEITPTITGSTATALYNIGTKFDETYEFTVVASDGTNEVTQIIKVKDNMIKTKEDLQKFSNNVNAGQNYTGETVTLNTDLDLTGIEFTPIGGNGSSAKYFAGTFDGQNHTIKNITIKSNSNYVGLFGYTKGATITNVGIEGTITSTGKQAVGGIVGNASNTTIEKCYSAINIEAVNGKNVGGIIGTASDTIKVKDCYNSGNITANSAVGGIIGRTSTVNATIQNCYNIGTVTGTNQYVGEIIGYRFATEKDSIQSAAEVTNCYFIGEKGIGETYNNITVNDSSAKITDIPTLLANLGEEFKNDTTGINNNYPILKWQKTETAVKTYAMRAAVEDFGLIKPVSTSYTISSEFGTRVDPVTEEESNMHYGIDIAAAYKTPVLAVADGLVTFAGENGAYGYCVEIKHEINGETLYTVYAHLSRIDVAVGDTVTQGTQIGLEGGVPGEPGAGKTTGAHLHFEIRKTSGLYSSAVNPRDYLNF